MHAHTHGGGGGAGGEVSHCFHLSNFFPRYWLVPRRKPIGRETEPRTMWLFLQSKLPGYIKTDKI